ncbi:MAG: hypothetical protein AB1760_00315 [Pseudomonadota bacterium]
MTQVNFEPRPIFVDNASAGAAAGAGKATADAYADMLWARVHGLPSITVYCRNTGATNTAKYKVVASCDGGTTYDQTVLAETTLAANTAATPLVITGAPYTDIKVQAASNAAGSATTFYASVIALPVGAGLSKTTGTAVPPNVVAIGASDGTNLQAAKCDAAKNVLVGISGSNGYEATTTTAIDGMVTLNGIGALSMGLYFNGANWERARGNVSATLLASAARTASTNSADQTNYNGRGVRVSIDVTALTGTPSITVTIKSKDSASGVYSTVLASGPITAIGHTELTVYPGITATNNVSANTILSRTWRVEVTHGTADSITYSIAADTLL